MYFYGDRLMKVEGTGQNMRTRIQLKIFMMSPVSVAPPSCKMLDSTSSQMEVSISQKGFPNNLSKVGTAEYALFTNMSSLPSSA
ncbi:hypothetical protein RvY_04369 [Ramazzottius varieornatus]|uniref:Uncharacterized protein n=1 Tax=Ramazzottius varieornatus TaxID=947166 RepID=A0A1D1V1F4_RAMVA|nr:hypothetical protein RvY_04369 [Ramazzottius varieornatus]